MSVTALANRYARALADVIFAKNETEEIFAELKAFQSMIEANPELHEVVVNPTIPQNQKENLLTALVTRMKLSQTTVNFLSLLLRNQRLVYLHVVIECLSRETDQRTGVVAAEITTAQALGTEQREALHTRLKQVTGKEVRMTFSTDEDLLGGVVTRIGSRIYDGSIRNQLDTFQTQMSQN